MDYPIYFTTLKSKSNYIPISLIRVLKFFILIGKGVPYNNRKVTVLNRNGKELILFNFYRRKVKFCQGEGGGIKFHVQTNTTDRYAFVSEGRRKHKLYKRLIPHWPRLKTDNEKYYSSHWERKNSRRNYFDLGSTDFILIVKTLNCPYMEPI